MASLDALDVSVIICAHNPRTDYLERVLEALRRQSLAMDRWELLVIDNASEEPLAKHLDLAWHPNARCIRENELGLTPARLRGIFEAEAELLVWVDDDNVLAEDYLEQAIDLGEAHQFLGAWGGSSIPEFEAEPERWLAPYVPEVCLRTVEVVRWARNPGELGPCPSGAGLCVRRTVARHFAVEVAKHPTRKLLGRRGSSLMSAEDVDMVLGCIDLDYGYGLFPALRLTHLISARRVSAPYLKRLIYAKAFSWTVLSSIRFGAHDVPALRGLWRNWLSTLLRRGPRHAAMVWARQKGRRDATLYVRYGKLAAAEPLDV